MPFQQLTKLVAKGWGYYEEAHEDPIVKNRRMLGQEAIHPDLVAAEAFHNLEVLQLVPLFSEVNLEKKEKKRDIREKICKFSV